MLGVAWITVLRSTSIQPLVACGVIQVSLFEEKKSIRTACAPCRHTGVEHRARVRRSAVSARRKVRQVSTGSCSTLLMTGARNLMFAGCLMINMLLPRL